MPEDKTAKRLERLRTLNDQKLERQKKLNDLSARIKKVKQDIHADEVKKLDNICAEKGITYEDICNFLEAVNMPLSEILVRLDHRAVRIRNTEENNIERIDEHE